MLLLGVGAVAALLLMALASRAGASVGAPALVPRMDARRAFVMVRAEQPELVTAATEETQRLGELRVPHVMGVLEFVAGAEGGMARFGTVQAIARAVELSRREYRLMLAGLLQRVLERMVGRA